MLQHHRIRLSGETAPRTFGPHSLAASLAFGLLVITLSVVGHPALSADSEDVYSGPWPVSHTTVRPDVDRYSGRRDQYESVDPAELIKQPQAFSDRRVRFPARTSMVIGGWSVRYRLIGVKERADFSSFEVTSPGEEQGALPDYPNPSRAPIGGYAAVQGEGFGIVDVTPTLGYQTDSLNIPFFRQRFFEPREVVLPARPSLEAGIAGLSHHDPIRDRQLFAFALLARPDEERWQEAAVTGYERWLLQNRGRSPQEEKAAFFQLGWLHERYTGKLGLAIQCYRRAHVDFAEVPGYQGAAGVAHARCLERIGCRSQARQLYLSFVRAYPHDFWATNALERLRALGAAGDCPSVVLTPAEVRITRQALGELNRGHYRSVLQTLAPMLATNTTDPWCRLHAVTAAILIGDTRRAAAWCKEAEDLSPQLMTEYFQTWANAASPLGNRLLELVNSSRRAWNPQLTLVETRDRLQQFPQDPLACAIRMGAATQTAARAFGIAASPLADQIRQLTGNSVLGALYELNYVVDVVEHKSHSQKIDPDELRQLTLRSAALQERLLRIAEEDFWGYHGQLAVTLGEGDPRARKHERRYDWFERRAAKRGRKGNANETAPPPR